MRKSKVLITSLLLFTCVLIHISARVSQQYPVEHYTVYHGLPQSAVNKVYMTEGGVLWIGTTDGLSRYDGYSFDNFQAYRQQTNGLQNDYILDIDEDEHNNIWVLTPVGIAHRNSAKQTFDHYPFSLPGGVANDFFYDKVNHRVFVSNGYAFGFFDFAKSAQPKLKIINSFNLDNSLGFLYHNPALWIFNQRFLYYYSTLEPLFSKLSDLPYVEFPSAIKAIQTYDSSNLVVLTADALWLFNFAQNTFSKLIQLNQLQGKATDFQPKLVIDSKGRILLADMSALQCFDPLTNTHEILYQEGEHSAQQITDYLFDKSGILWIGTTNGLKRVIPRKHGFSLHTHKNLTFNSRLIPDLSNRQFLFVREGMNNDYVLFPSEKEITEPFVSENTPDIISHASNDGFLFVGTDRGLFQLRDNLFFSVISGAPVIKVTALQNYSDTLLLLASDSLNQIITKKGGNYRFTQQILDSTRVVDMTLYRKTIIITTESSVYQYQLNTDSNQQSQKLITIPSNYIVNDVCLASDSNLWIATNQGILFFDIRAQKIREIPMMSQYNDVLSLIEDSSNRIWASCANGVVMVNIENKAVYYFSKTDGVIDADYIPGAAIYSNNKIYFGGKNELLQFYPDSIFINWHRPQTVFTYATIQKGDKPVDIELYDRDTLSLYRSTKYAKISFSALDYYAPFYNNYQYSLALENKHENWVQIGSQNYILLEKLEAGTYHLKIRAYNSHGVSSYRYARLVLVVDTPIWESKVAYFFYGLLAIILVYLLIYFRTKHLQNVNQEYKEKERIARKIQIQKEELSLKNKNITDSINYARRIQMAMMPSERFFKSYFPDSFILYAPKDIVSGDFYWINEVNNQIYFSAVDCTGHGVPGAFMSIIGFELFRRITEKEGVQTPSVILNQLSFDLQSLFADEEQLHDGMDLALCSIDKEYKTMQFSGAFNPLYLVRDNSIQEFKGDRFSVGWNGDEAEVKDFTNHSVDLREGDVLYIFTDGFADQFGGPEGKKYKYRRFRHLLLALHQLSMDRQREFLLKSIMEWKGDLDQVDDILVIGIRINRQMLKK